MSGLAQHVGHAFTKVLSAQVYGSSSSGDSANDLSRGDEVMVLSIVICVVTLILSVLCRYIIVPKASAWIQSKGLCLEEEHDTGSIRAVVEHNAAK
eukprot:scaffold4165_cov194-Ochromonas_danica.AAC.2